MTHQNDRELIRLAKERGGTIQKFRKPKLPKRRRPAFKPNPRAGDNKVKGKVFNPPPGRHRMITEKKEKN